MQRTDRFEAFPEADPSVVARQIAHLKQRADLVVYAAPHLMATEAQEVRRQVLVTHGVDFERFVEAGSDAALGAAPPADLAHLPRPRVGTFVGRKPYDEVANYMAAVDCLIMPWNESDWIKACNPIKLKEYLAVGKPVVTTDFAALEGWRDLVTVARGAEAFETAIRSALAAPGDALVRRLRVSGEGWDAKAELVARSMLDLGLAFDGVETKREAA